MQMELKLKQYAVITDQNDGPNYENQCWLIIQFM